MQQALLKSVICALLLVSISTEARENKETRPSSNHKAQAEKRNVVSVALNWKPEPQFGGFYAAQITKADQEKGIDLQLVSGGVGTPIVAMLASGKIDFGIVSADELVLSRNAKSDLVALFAVYQVNPSGILVRANRGFKSIQDVFKNQGTLALQKGLPHSLYLQRKFGNSMQVNVVPYVGGVSNFLADEKHSQQCFVTAEPFMIKDESIKTQTFLMSESGYNPYTTVLATRRSFFESHKELVQKLIQVVQKGWEQYLDSKSTTASVHQVMLQLNSSLDLKMLARSAQAQVQLIRPTSKFKIGSMTEARWDELAQQLLALKLIDKSLEAKQYYIPVD